MIKIRKCIDASAHKWRRTVVFSHALRGLSDNKQGGIQMKRLAMVLSLILVFCVSMFAGAYADNMGEAALILHEPVSKKSETTEPVEPVVTLEMAKGGKVKLAFTTEGDSEWGKITKKQWATSDKTIATVSNGTINGKSAGEAIITLLLLYCSYAFIVALLFMFIIIPLIPILVGINNFVSVLETLLKKVVLLDSTFKLLSSTIRHHPFKIN